MFAPHDGPVHRYMMSSPACWDAFGGVLACEYSDPALMPTHRLSVDTYAMQHPGDDSRAAVQSIGLHLARLMIQLASPLPPKETNNVMLGLGQRKSSLPTLRGPRAFRMTVAEVAPHAGTAKHAEIVREWARSTWDDWAEHHIIIRAWVESQE